MSAITTEGTQDIVAACAEALSKLPPVKKYEPDFVRPEKKTRDRDFQIERDDDGEWEIIAPWLERILMQSNIEDYESLNLSAWTTDDHVNDLVQSAIFGIIAVMVTLWAGIHFASGGIGGTSNWVAAFALGFFPLVEAFAPVANAVTQAETHAETIARLGSLPEEGDEDYVQAADEPQGATSTDPEPTTAASEPAVVPQPRAALGLDAQSVSYTYPGATSPALDNLTLHITAGQKVAILGRSGAGKSTLAQVLRGDITPQAGTVRIGAQPVSEIGNAMHEFIGLVQQQNIVI